MEALPRLVKEIKAQGWASNHLLGFLHIMVGRRVTRTTDGVVVSTGLSWRDLASLLKKVRWDPDSVVDLGLDPKTLPPRDRERFWYAAITKAQLDSPAAKQAGEEFALILKEHGFEVGAATTPPKQI